MVKNRTGNNKFLKKYNETGILDLIRVNGEISRAELTALTGLSATAIGAIVSNLIIKGYAYETGTGRSKGGRKPVLVELKPDSYYSVGIDIDVDIISCALLDITGRTVHECCSKLESCLPEEVEATIECKVRKLLNDKGIELSRLLGIGISIPGMVDSETHRVVMAPNLGWENVDIGPGIHNTFNVPVYIENEAMASAICENWIGACRDIGNFVCINIKSGIGAGIFTGGRLYRGAGGSAGEVGHIVVDENGPKCGCGNYGCLETMASTTRLVEKARRLVKQGVDSCLNAAEDIGDIDIDFIVKAARAGDEAAMGILLESARFLGIALSGIVNTLNPSKIVLGKEFVKYGDLIMDRIKNIVVSKALRQPVSMVELEVSGIGERASTLGAAIIPLKVLFGR